MDELTLSASPRILHVLIATQSQHTGIALASLLGDPDDIFCEIVGMDGGLPLVAFQLRRHCVDVVLLDLEPWSVKALYAVAVMKAYCPPPLVLALVHAASEPIRRQCQEAGVDHLLDRTADLGRLQSVLGEYANTRRLRAPHGREAL